MAATPLNVHSFIHYRSVIMQPEILSKPDNKTANINVKKTVVLNKLVTMTLISDVETAKTSVSYFLT